MNKIVDQVIWKNCLNKSICKHLNLNKFAQKHWGVFNGRDFNSLVWLWRIEQTRSFLYTSNKGLTNNTQNVHISKVYYEVLVVAIITLTLNKFGFQHTNDSNRDKL